MDEEINRLMVKMEERRLAKLEEERIKREKRKEEERLAELEAERIREEKRKEEERQEELKMERMKQLKQLEDQIQAKIEAEKAKRQKILDEKDEKEKREAERRKKLEALKKAGEEKREKRLEVERKEEMERVKILEGERTLNDSKKATKEKETQRLSEERKAQMENLKKLQDIEALQAEIFKREKELEQRKKVEEKEAISRKQNSIQVSNPTTTEGSIKLAGAEPRAKAGTKVSEKSEKEVNSVVDISPKCARNGTTDDKKPTKQKSDKEQEKKIPTRDTTAAKGAQETKSLPDKELNNSNSNNSAGVKKRMSQTDSQEPDKSVISSNGPMSNGHVSQEQNAGSQSHIRPNLSNDAQAAGEKGQNMSRNESSDTVAGRESKKEAHAGHTCARGDNDSSGASVSDSSAKAAPEDVTAKDEAADKTTGQDSKPRTDNAAPNEGELKGVAASKTACSPAQMSSSGGKVVEEAGELAKRTADKEEAGGVNDSTCRRPTKGHQAAAAAAAVAKTNDDHRGERHSPVQNDEGGKANSRAVDSESESSCRPKQVVPPPPTAAAADATTSATSAAAVKNADRPAAPRPVDGNNNLDAKPVLRQQQQPEAARRDLAKARRSFVEGSDLPEVASADQVYDDKVINIWRTDG